VLAERTPAGRTMRAARVSSSVRTCAAAAFPGRPESPATWKERPVATLVFVLPIVQGKEDFDRESLQRMAAPGPERDAYVAARRAQGITREAVWHQRTPMGTSAIVLMEGDDPNAAMGAMITSQDPFDTQFRQFVKEVHGVDLAADAPPDVTPVVDNRF
jgi:hypothetical protein